ncbi:SDR family NAD(P)-dependent oxidoreductase [Opitutales bacterium]|jgi:benzil reductase ((S)-benzoin forming)|nr:SDR family NAD(P)-dependent oxidoreductase [Opitutales bacterium]MDB2506788.1 SDR family NAD(P)-dependent oxidoreductase [Opitutales bacterium]
MSLKVFITGVSTGLGHGLAKVYLKQGATVYGCSRRAPDDLIEQGLIFETADLADAPSASQAIDRLLAGVGALDLVILNAGKLGKIRDFSDTPLADFRETMEINLMANKWLLDSVYAGGRGVEQVVAISSGASLSGHRGWNGYSVSKAALNMLIQLYANERLETHFTALAPGLIDTAMQDYLTGLPADERYKPLAILKAAKGTELMPSSDECAAKLVAVVPKLRDLPSGSYADIRKL